MPSPKSVKWQLEPHTAAKHAILRKYLGAWLPILTSWHGRVVILDGFAGPGEYAGGEPGSPVIALDTFLNHSSAQVQSKQVTFFFVENDQARCDHLRQLLGTRQIPSTATVEVVCGPFDETLTTVLNQIEARSLRLAPTFAFVDPFGYSHTPMATIARLMKHPSCEVLVNFMYEEINRFLSFNNAANEARLDALFGTSGWRAIVAQQLTPDERESRLHDLYQRQLQVAAGAKYVRSFRMRNRNNRTDYFLFFATNSLKGLDKMKQAMWGVDPTGAFDFSDATDPNQPVLFSATPDFDKLKKALKGQFSGKTVTVQDIESFVIAGTPFYSSQYKVNALKPMEKAGEIEAVSPPASRRAGTYADMSMRIKFK